MRLIRFELRKSEEKKEKDLGTKSVILRIGLTL